MQKKSSSKKKKSTKTPATKKVIKPDFDDSNPYYNIINQVIDPELGVGIADMGLIYSLEVDKFGLAKVVMTLTSMGCPMGPEIAGDIDAILHLQDEINHVEIDLVWDPPWTPELMNAEMRTMLFGN